MENAKAIISEAAKALREERQTGDFPKYAIGLSPSPLEEGKYKGYYRLLLPLSVLVDSNERGVALAGLNVKDNPAIALFAEGYLRHFMLAAMFKPLQPHQ